MYRYVSFGLLVAVILILAFVFYKVMAGFFLPLFLAALLVVVFRPLHGWILKKVRGRPKLAAFLTTTTILFIVLLPFTLTVFFAAREGHSVIRKLDSTAITGKIDKLRLSMGLEMPAQQSFERIEKVITEIGNQAVLPNIDQQRAQVQYDITELRGLAIELAETLTREGLEVHWAEEEPADTGDETTTTSGGYPGDFQEFARELTASRQMLSDELWNQLQDDVDQQQKQLTDARDHFKSSMDQFYVFKTRLLGGPARSWLTVVANPNQEQLNEYVHKGTTWLRSRLVSFGSATTAFVGRFLFGTVIMALALFSFLLDGPAMIKGLKGLTPLDDDHENELIEEFDRVSRAVVLATLLSALAQGVLAAIGFYFAGFHSIFLLFLLTSVLALIPFVGAAAVWVPCAMWLAFIDGRVAAGVILAVYGGGVISMADNVIKPFVLHGQSNLHPLWALLSVLGGVSALGPVGILIGPMIVAFLQTMLKILQREISSIDSTNGIVEAAET